MKSLALAVIIILIQNTFVIAIDTGSDSDFEGAEIVLPKSEGKSLDSSKFVENYADYSEFQEGDDAEELDAEGFFHKGRMLGLAVDLGIGGYTMGYSELNDPAMRAGLRLSYFYGISFALEFGMHYQKHAFHLYMADGVNGYTGENQMTSFEINGKYYIDTRTWSDFVSWINPHFYFGVESITITIDAPYGLSEPGPSEPTKYVENERIWAFLFGIGFEFQLFSTTYLGINAKYHFANYPHEGIYSYDYSFTGDTWSFDTGLIFYF